MTLNEYDSIITGKGMGEANEYDGIIADMDQENKVPLKGAMFVASKKNPDQAAKVIKLAKDEGLDEEVVERNYDELAEKPPLAENEYDQFIRQSPATAEWLSENPNNAAASKDDLKNLNYLERQWRYIKRIS